MSLEFDADTHTYRADGLVVPGVTGILENVGIIDYDALPWDVREKALRRGSAVHTACHFDDEGDLNEEKLSPELIGYLTAWRKFRTDSHFEPQLIEHRSFHAQHRYAGTLDRTGTFLVMDEPWLLDIKTTTAPWWTKLQTAAYAAFFENPGTFRRIAVALRADGTYRSSEYLRKDWRADFNAFLAALSVYNLKQENE